MNRFVVVLIHIAYWMAYTFLFAFAVFAYTIDVKDENGLPYANTVFTAGNIGFLLICFFLNAAIAFYTSYLFLYPRFFQRKKIWQLIALGVLSVFVANYTVFLVVYLIAGFYMVGTVAPGIILIMGVITGVHAVLGIVIRGFITSYKDIKVKQELKSKNLQMELELIKAQINPHFLFNTINNIDVLIRKDPEQASTYLNKLSDILRYMLYETQTEKVPFSKEVENIEKYLELQKIRSSNPEYIHYETKGDFNPLVAPMLFMPYIENAVKHTENKKAEKAIRVKFKVDSEWILFECSNTYSDGHAAQELKGGLGNDLAKKRLELLYPGKHTLDVSKSGGTYGVKLVISLA